MDEQNVINNVEQTGAPMPSPDNIGAYNPVIKPQPVKKVYPFNNKDFYYLIFAAIATFLLIRLGFFNGFNFGFSVTYSILSAGTLVYVRSKDCKNKLLYSLMFIINLILSLSFTLHDNGGIKFLTVIVILFTSSMTLNGVNGTALCNDGTFLKLVDIIYVSAIEPLMNLTKLFDSVKAVFKSRNNKFVMVLAGVLISVPVLAIVIPLLSSADAAFNTIVEKVFSNAAILVASLILTVLLVPFIASYGFSLSSGIVKEKNKSFNSKPGKVSTVFLNTFLSIIGFIYVVFLVSQLAYISDTFAFLLPEEFSAAEFARSGFFQMGAIAFINLLITFLVSVTEKPKENGKLPLSTKLILTFFTAFSLFLTVNAFIRMSMYINMYGLTRLRVLTSVFMIMLCIIFVIILIRIFNEKFKYINFVIITCAVTFLLVSVSNIDSVISKYNYEKYTEGKIEIDFEHYESLGNGAVPELIKIAEEDESYVTRYLARDTLADILYNEYDYYDIRYYDAEYEYTEPFDYESNIFGYNRSKEAAGEALEKHFSDVFKKGVSIGYVDEDMLEYDSIVATYGAESFMPDFSNTFDDIYTADFTYSSCNYNEKDINTAEISLVYDEATYKDAMSFINSRYEFSGEFAIEDYTYKVVKNTDGENSVALIAFRESDCTVAYLWASGEEPISFEKGEDFVLEVFSTNFMVTYY